MENLKAAWNIRKLELESDPKWQQNNLEHDLRNSNLILKKVRTSDSYAQNLYAALCNNEFQRNDVYPILSDKRWSCSWRYAGGIIADMQQKGDYMDWYCSGIGTRESGYGLDYHEPIPDPDGRDYAPEGVVTEEIELDLNRLGWIVLEEDNQ